MKTISRQVLCLMLALCLCITALPMPALATDGQTPEDAVQETQPQTEPAGSDTEATPASSDPPQETPQTAEPTPAPSDTPDAVDPAEPEPTPSTDPEGEEAGESEPTPEQETPAQPESSEPTPAPEQPEAPEATPAPEEANPTPEPTPALTPEPTPALEPTLVPSDGLLAGLDIESISYAVVDEPLVKVTYHYTDVQVATPTNLPTTSGSAHSYYPLTKLDGGRMTIPANLFPGEVSVSTDALRVTLDDELDITAQAEYDAASGTLYLPARYWGHKVDVDWYCPYEDVTSITISVRAGVKIDSAFEEEKYTLTLPSNASTIEIPLPQGGNAVVTQYGIDLPTSAHSIKNGVMYLTASPLGGDITVTAYAEAPRMRLFATRSTQPTQVIHTRSADQIWYGYYTSYYEANGNVAFCLDPTVSGLDAGTYDIDYWLTDGSDLLVKCCYYLYGGPGYSAVRHVFAEPDALWAYGMCHAMASYAYMGSMDAFKGLGDELTGQLVTIANAINGLPSAPDGFECFVYNSGSSTQPLIGWQYNPGSDPWEPDPEPPEPDPTGSVAVRKVSADPTLTDGNPCYSLAGAVFDVYSGSYRVGSITTNSSGYGSLSGLAVGSGYTIVERTPPSGFAGTTREYSFSIYEDDTTTVTVENVPQNDPTTIMVRKQDADTNSVAPQGGAGLAGAQFTIKYYKGSYSSASALSGVTPARTWVVETDEDGFAMLHPDYKVSGDAFYYNSTGDLVTLPLGTISIQETKAPAGYLLNNEVFIRQITPAGNMESVETFNEPVVKESVIRGGVSVQKWDAELNRKEAQGDASLQGAVFEIINKNDNSVVVNGQTYAPNAVVFTLTTDASGAASTANNLLPYGNWELSEKSSPSGYLNTGTIRRSFKITQNGAMVSLNTADSAIKNDVIRGGVLIQKWDAQLNRAEAQGDATLEGAILDVYNISAHSVIVDGVEYAPGEVVLTLETDAAGAASVGEDTLPFGSYQISERTPPEGYLNSGVVKQAFQVREDGAIVNMTTDDKVIRNEIIRGNVTVQKRDNETGENQAQGGGTLEGAVFEIVNRSRDSVLVQDVLYAPGEVVYTMETDETGTATTPEYLLPYATFEVREISPPLEGYLSTGVLSRFFEIREHGKTVMLDTAETAIRNDPLRGDLAGVKIADSTLKRLAGVPFRITSLTTGESHVVVTDKNGEFSTASEWNPHSQNTNRGESAEDGVWFGDIDTLDDGKGALLYDDYLLEELPCEANEGYELVSLEVSVYRHNTLLHLGTLTDDVIPVPEISTTALEKESMGNHAYAAERVTIVDTVYYSGLQAGKEYTLKGVLMDKSSGEPIVAGSGQVTVEKTFRAIGESGSATMEFTFDATALQGASVVVFERLYQDEKEIAAHADISDEGQTIHFSAPEIGTTATGEQGEKVLDATDETVIVDTVSYTGLIPGQQYTVKGTLMDKATAAPIQADGKPVVAETSFTPDAADGTVEVIFTFDAVALRNASVVVFERLYHNGREIAVHTDINDAAQTVSFQEIKIGTKATGRNSEKTLPVSSAMTIVDTVSYDGLAVGQEYTLKGTLMSKADGKPIQVDGKPVTAQTRFKPEKETGTVEVVFTFDGSALSGQQLVVFESLLLGETEIAAHKDIGDAGQTVSVGSPKIGTSAKGKNGEKELSVSQSVTIVDTVTYEGLAPGTEYTIKGVLMDQESGKPIQNGGKDITAQVTLKPDKSSGSVDVLFTFDASGLAGRKVVVFETLYLGGTEIASHKDLKDEGQTVSFHQPEIGTSAAGKDGGKVLVISKAATIVDTVTYKGLSTGQKYTLRGTLMDKTTGKALLVDGKEVTAEATFIPDKPDGKVEVTFTFDASGLMDRQVVVFEKLLLGESVIAVHEDIEDKAQTVAFVSHALKITKIDKSNNKKLDGAEFTLYGADGKAINLSKDKDGMYYPDDGGSAIISTVDGVAVVKGLLSQQYTLREVTVPEGYEGYDEPLAFVMELRDTEDDPFPIVIYNAPEGYKEGSGAKTGRGGLPVWALITGIGLLAAGAAVGVVYLRRRKAD